MAAALRSLILGLVLIAGVAAVLLVSDLRSRVGAAGGSAPGQLGGMRRVALLQHASQAVLDEGVRGVVDGLAEKGYVEGKNLSLRKFNAEGDITVSNAIAKEMASGGNELLLTCSTVSLQSVASANRATQKPHVFALVTDPSAAGVGISKDDPLDHPAWLVGYGTMQPIEQAFRVAREMNPSVRRVGVVWNAAEANSEAQIAVARRVCAEIGIELVEVTVDGSAGVGEATGALCARGVDALFVPGDVMVLVAIDPLIAAAGKAGVAVFTVIPPNAKRGAVFDLGANYHEVGKAAGRLAGEILDGRDPATVGIVNYLPETLVINEQAAAGLAEKGWKIPETLRQRAQVLIDTGGQETPGPAAKPSPSPAAGSGSVAARRARPWNLQAVIFMESLPAEETLAGLREGMRKWPWVEGRDYTFNVRNAQGDIAALNGIIDAALGDRADIVIPISTPSLQAAVRKVTDRPVVFSMVANPIAAGAGKSYEEHLPNVTGITVLGPVDEMLDLLEKYFPQYKRIGTLFCPAEANSADLKEILMARGKARGFKVDVVAANSPAELADAAMSLAGRPIDAIVQISDNLSSAGFTAIARAARQTRKPLFSLNSTTVPLGAAVAIGRDYHDVGIETAVVLERVMRGESPGEIPFMLSPRVMRTADVKNGRAVGLELPHGLLDEMEKVTGQ
jgi:ABC-type uncharacterized transport system substrate-binding protein